MLNEKHGSLSGKIRGIIHPHKPTKPPETLQFYKKYAAFVLKTLRNPRFQRFLKWIMRREKIKENKVQEVQVRVFPFQNENGNGLAGRYKSNGQILIFPKRFDFCRGLMQEHGKEKALSYIKNRAQAALIHELLHIKYSSDEKKVRKLTKEYFNIFAENSENTYNLSRMLFKE